MIEELLRRIGLTEEEWKTKALMIGDRKYDAEGAALFGIPCLGTSMGFARRESWKQPVSVELSTVLKK